MALASGPLCGDMISFEAGASLSIRNLPNSLQIRRQLSKTFYRAEFSSFLSTAWLIPTA